MKEVGVNSVRIEPFSWSLHQHLVTHFDMREHDRFECVDMMGLWPEEALAASINRSIVSYVIVEEKPGKSARALGFYGIGDWDGELFTIWLLCNEDIKKHPLELTRTAKAEVNSLLKSFPQLFNYVSEQNKDIQRWLRALGFTIDETPAYSRSRTVYRKFSKGV